jgi:hypothetical protein
MTSQSGRPRCWANEAVPSERLMLDQPFHLTPDLVPSGRSVGAGERQR